MGRDKNKSRVPDIISAVQREVWKMRKDVLTWCSVVHIYAGKNMAE